MQTYVVILVNAGISGSMIPFIIFTIAQTKRYGHNKQPGDDCIG